MHEMEVNGLKVAYVDEGGGETVLLAHCSNGSSREWASLRPRLTDAGYRAISPDFTGYGRSDAWPGERPFDPDADVNILLVLAERVEGPLHLVGHSYGGAVALEAAMRLEGRLRSLTLIEPILFQFLREANNRHWRVVRRLGLKVRHAVDTGDTRRAASIFTRFWIGWLRWWLMPERAKRAIAQSMRKVVREFEIIDLAHRSPSDYARLKVPIRLVLGSRTRTPARIVTRMLHDALPHAELVTLRAGHMSPFTHADRVNDLVLEHLRRVDVEADGTALSPTKKAG